MKWPAYSALCNALRLLLLLHRHLHPGRDGYVNAIVHMTIKPTTATKNFKIFHTKVYIPNMNNEHTFNSKYVDLHVFV